MDLDDLAVNYYHESLALAQKSLVSGVTVSGVAYLAALSGIGKASYTIPFLGVEVASLNYFSISLLCLYFACGVLCMHGMSKAHANWRLISNIELSRRLLQVPNILMAGIISKAFLYAGLFFVGAQLSAQILSLEGWKVIFAGSVVGLPYFAALRESSYFETPPPVSADGNPN